MNNFGNLEREYLEPPTPVEPPSFDEWVANWSNVCEAMREAMHSKADRLIRGVQAEDANEAGNPLIDILRDYYEQTA